MEQKRSEEGTRHRLASREERVCETLSALIGIAGGSEEAQREVFEARMGFARVREVSRRKSRNDSRRASEHRHFSRSDHIHPCTLTHSEAQNRPLASYSGQCLSIKHSTTHPQPPHRPRRRTDPPQQHHRPSNLKHSVSQYSKQAYKIAWKSTTQFYTRCAVPIC